MIFIKYIQHEFIDAGSKCGNGNQVWGDTLIGFTAMKVDGEIRIQYNPYISGLEAIGMVKEKITALANELNKK